MTYLFVYGTLQSPYKSPLSDLFQSNTKFISKGNLQGRLFLIDYFPAFVEATPAEGYAVHGEIYEIIDEEKLFRILDTYEDYSPTEEASSLYLRRKRIITSPDSHKFSCWMYIYNQPIINEGEILSGDFLAFISEQDK